MARLRFKLEINPGGHGVRLDKLGRLSELAERFLRSLAEDAGAKLSPGDLVASDFYDGSFGSTVEAVADVPEPVVASFDASILTFAHYGRDNSNPRLPEGFSKRTLRHYIDLGDEMDSDEAIKVGLIGDREQPQWEKLTKTSMFMVKSMLEAPYKYRGAIQGRMATWYKDRSYFNLKPFSHNITVKCFYDQNLYNNVYKAFEDKDAVVHAIGEISAERITGEPTDMRVFDVKVYTRLTDAQFKEMAGSAPNIIGDADVISFIDEMRDDADG